MAPTVFRNAHIFTSSPETDELSSGSLIIDNASISYVGPHEDTIAGAAEVVDLSNRIVTPGFIDAHVHLLHFGMSLGKLDLVPCRSLEAIRQKIAEQASSHPSAPRILCKGWIQTSTDGQALATMIDDLDPRPIYIEAMDLHSVWCNTAALEELGVASIQDPPGGTIHRDLDGNPTGLLSETAVLSVVIPHLAGSMTAEERQDALGQAISAYTSAGYTGVIDMAMDEGQWAALQNYRQNHVTPLHIAAHWLVPYHEDDAEVQASLDKAIEMHRTFHPQTSPSFCIVGIKLIADGVVDSCTAALSQPYAANADPVDPIWPADKLAQVVGKADAAGLQVAIHAIGDRAITNAIDAFAALPPTQPDRPPRRHRIEHLELASARDVQRLGELGIVASVQPVHSDPVLFRAWPSLLGSHRCGRAFPYREILDAGAPVAFGTDAPTAAHLPLPNLYSATTRRSAIEPESQERTTPQFAVGLPAALRAATAGAAYSRRAENWIGSLKAGMSADFVVLETDWTPEGLLRAKVHQTWFRGEKWFDSARKENL